MKRRISEAGVTSVLILLVSVTVSGQVPEPQGELQLYHRATQIGTVASREFKDARGRVVRAIYYTGGGDNLQDPYREELLREQSIRTHTYDDYDCRIRSEFYEPGMKLRRTEEVRCVDRTATPSKTVIRNALGVKEMEIRHDAHGGTQTELFLDGNGDKVIALRGEVPTDLDLVYGWGEEVSGFACGIAANREKGRQEDINVYITIKNLGRATNGSVMISPVLVELKDRAGRVVERLPGYEDHRGQASASLSGQCPTDLGLGAPSTGRAELQNSVQLGEQYGPLTPGKYSFTMTYCVTGVSVPLISNTILLEVLGSENR